MIKPPVSGSYAPYYETYIKRLVGTDAIKLLESSLLDFKFLLSEVSDEKENFRYEPSKWSVKEVVGHVIDTERIMCSRALCIARGEKKALAGFNEVEYVSMAQFYNRTLYDLSHEFGFVRAATISLFKSLRDEDLDRSGTADNNLITARSILFIIAGHHLHHEGVLKERYLFDV